MRREVERALVPPWRLYPVKKRDKGENLYRYFVRVPKSHKGIQ